MNTLHSLVLASTISLLAQGCAATTDEPSGSTESAISAPGSVRAKIRSIALTQKKAQCAVSGSFLQVSLPDELLAAETEINKRLVRTLPDLTGGVYCGTGHETTYTVNVAMTVEWNRGFLSVRETRTTPDGLDTSASNYDLRTGERLRITDVITESARRVLSKECSAQVSAGVMANANRERAEQICAIGYGSDDSAAWEGDFVVQEDGLHLPFRTFSRRSGPGYNGVLVGWESLGGASAASHPALADYLR